MRLEERKDRRSDALAQVWGRESRHPASPHLLQSIAPRMGHPRARLVLCLGAGKRHNFVRLSPAGASVTARFLAKARSLRRLVVFPAGAHGGSGRFVGPGKGFSRGEVRQNPVFAFLGKSSLPRQGKPYHFRFSSSPFSPLLASKTMRFWRDAALGFCLLFPYV